MKKKITLLMVLLLLVSIVSCGKKTPETDVVTEPNAEFDAFVEGYTAALFEPEDFSLNFYFDHPEDYGFERGNYTLSYMDKSDWDEYMSESEADLEKLHSFALSTLTQKQQLTYYLLENELQSYLAVKNFYYHDNAYLGTYLKFQASLPIYLEEFTFNDEKDLIGYFSMLEDAPTALHNYYLIEVERQKQGVGLNTRIMEGIIEQANKVADDPNYYLIEEFNAKADEFDFEYEGTLDQLKAKNKELIINSLQAAYRTLAEELSTIDTSGMDGKTLADMPGGKDYYNALLITNVGISMTGDELEVYLDEWIDKGYEEFISVYWSMDASEASTAFDSPQTDFDDYLPLYEYLYAQMEGDFPLVGFSAVDVKKINEANAENTSPAMYFTSKIDTDESVPERILVNGIFDPMDFQTYAHEGYPGHLYQTVYVKKMDLPIIHQILGSTGYAEGWATYAENYALKYSTLTENQQKAYYYNNLLTYALYAKMDVLINYKGYSLEEFNGFISEWFGTLDQETLESIYYQLLEEPTNTLYYYVSFLRFTDLCNRMKEVRGSSYTDLEFHTFIVEHAGLSFDQLDALMEEYLQKK
ncbi:MAG: DUF885 domain-containing protein [Erysipelotrichaceae bacterium]|jgi:uncharacterized protein (DUF885 family)|nr:DUF885 domain-containing protein [Erysipelotrichaceae bacterium]